MSLILVIDDNPVNLKLVVEVLRGEGHSVMPAVDAEQALELLEERLPDLVLTDIALPQMDGIALTRRLRADPRFRHLPIVALTASAMKADEARIMAAGCDAYFTKPIDMDTFAAQVLQVLAMRQRQS